MTFAVAGFGSGFGADRLLIERSNQMVADKSSVIQVSEVASGYVRKSIVDSDYILKSSLVGYGDGGIDSRRKLIDQAAFRSAADALELNLLGTSHKGHGARNEAADVRLRRAIFQSLYAVNASVDVLNGALDLLAAKWGSSISDYQAASVADCPRLIRLRYQWLTAEAKPALLKELANVNPVEQRAHSVEVPLPGEFDIVPGHHPTEIFSGQAIMESEIDLLGKRLAEATAHQ